MRRFLIVILLLGMTLPGVSAQDVDALLASMTRRQKIAQIIIDDINSQASPQTRATYEQWVREGIGGLIVMDDGLAPCLQLINELQAQSRIPMVISIDGEWGAAMRFYEFAAFPHAIQLGALDDEALVESAGRAIGEQLHDIKIFMNYAPVVDVNNNAANPVIGIRSFGEDPKRVARLGAAYMRGMQAAGVSGSAKHFPGHGDTDVDSHKGLPVLPFDRSRLDSVELYPFRRLIDEGVDMVMVGHLSVPALDPTGTPASISRPVVTELLRKELGFNGIIITDALGMNGVSGGQANAAVEAYKAGADILLMPRNTLATIDELETAFRNGELDEAELDARVRKILLLKQKAGMLAPDYSPGVDTATVLLKTVRPQTETLIQQICDRSMTVVRGKLRRPLVLHRRMAFTTRPKMAYVAYNATTPESEAFFKELSRHGRVARFDLPADATPQQIDSVEALLKGYRKVIVGIHAGDPVPRTGGPRRQASIDTARFSRIAAWSRKHRLYGVYWGNPYDLNKLNEYTRFKTFIIAYSDSHFNNIAAARALTEYRSAKGTLPVSAGDLPAGWHSNAF